MNHCECEKKQQSALVLHVRPRVPFRPLQTENGFSKETKKQQTHQHHRTPHRMTNQHRLLPINLVVELDRGLQPREVPIPNFEVVVREAPVVRREGEVVVVVP
jgi:hypothetical protein